MTGSATAREGSTVRVHYTGTLDDGTVFDTSRDDEPFEFILGEGIAIMGFERAILGMFKGEKKSVSISPEDAYGYYDLDLRVVVQRSKLPADIDYQEGMMLQIDTPEGNSAQATVVDISDEAITLDGNHPLSGESLNFEIELIGLF